MARAIIGKWRIVEMEEASGEGFAQLEPAGGLTGEINFHCGDEDPFMARRS